ncbi:hypothetical protein WM014_03715 [Bifidobacterium mongoliense]|nr:hypothetical protein [Bifidobacterium mongoliense]
MMGKRSIGEDRDRIWILNAVLSFVPLLSIAVGGYFLPPRVPVYFGPG